MQQPIPSALALLPLSPDEFEERLRGAVEEAIARALPDALRRAALGPYLTPKRVCELTGWSPRKVAYLREQRRLRYYQEGRSVLFRTDDVLALIEEGEVSPRPSGGPGCACTASKGSGGRNPLWQGGQR